MYRYLIATICMAITFSAVGCGQKKGGSKASMRARSGAFAGGAQKPGGNSAGQTDSEQKPGRETPEGSPEAADANTNKNEPCKDSIESITMAEGETKLEGELKSLKDPNSDKELVLDSVQHFFEHKQKDQATQIDIKALMFIDNADAGAAAAADAHTDVVCVNGADVEFALPNKISLKDGSYKVWRVFKAKNATADGENKINSFIDMAGDVETDEYKDLASGKESATHTFSKDKDGNVIWRMKIVATNSKDKAETKTFVMLAKYKLQTAATASPAAAPAAPATSGSAKP